MASSSLGQSTPRRGSTYRRAPLLLLITRRRLERGDRRERGPGPELQDDDADNGDGDKRGERRPLTFSACCCCCISASMIIRFSLVVLLLLLLLLLPVSPSSPPLAVHLSAASSSDESICTALPFDCSPRRRRSRSLSSSLLSTTATMLMSFSFSFSSSSAAEATLFGGFELAAVIRLISERQSFRPPVLPPYCWTTKFGCSFAAS